MTNSSPKGIIHGVPGMPAPDVEAVQEPHNPQNIDPTRVLGHPSNPLGNIGGAYAEYLESGAKATASEGVGNVALGALGVEEPATARRLITPEDIPK